MKSARAFAAAFTTGTRVDSGETYTLLRKGSPEWMTDALRAAHNDAMPDDWIWSACRSAVAAIAKHDSIEVAREADYEWAEDAADVYHHSLARWLAEVPGAWDAVSEYEQEMAHDMDSFVQRLRGGQFTMLCNIYAALCYAIEEQGEQDEG